MKEGEKLKPIQNMEDYFISNYGNVYSSKQGNLRQLTPYLDSRNRYYLIKLVSDGKRKSFLLHRLVANAFLENPQNYKEVNHIDNNPQNNCVDNLEWCTRKYNLEQSYKTMSPVRNYNQCKLFIDKKLVGEFQSIKAAARYAVNNYQYSYQSLCKYLRCGNCEIILKNKNNRINISDGKVHKAYNVGKVNLYHNDEFIGQFNSIEEIYRIYKEKGITLCKPYLIKTGKSGEYRIERIVEKCND